nr:cyanophycinase [Caldimonas mangrovi]
MRGGCLVIVGGAEDRKNGKDILRRFVDLLPRAEAPLYVLTAATQEPEAAWRTYKNAFADLGVQRCEPLHIASRAEANDEALAARVLESAGVFMTGGDQKRLLSRLGGSLLCDAMRKAYAQRAACIGGTSAGASAISAYMLDPGPLQGHPERDDTSLRAGLGFLLDVVIDQHFSERQRLGRLLGAVAHNPKLIGIGIDEDTALIVQRGCGIEVIGEGAITLIDGRDMSSSFLQASDREVAQLSDVRLHVLPAGVQCLADQDPGTHDGSSRPVSPRVLELVRQLCCTENADENYLTTADAE